MTVEDLFRVTDSTAIFQIVKDGENIWAGTQLERCSYRENEVKFLRVVGNPYTKEGLFVIDI